MDELERLFDKIKKLDGQTIDSLDGNIMFHNDAKLSNTPEEAKQQARADAIKKQLPFEEPDGNPNEDEIRSTIEKYVEDIMKERL